MIFILSLLRKRWDIDSFFGSSTARLNLVLFLHICTSYWPQEDILFDVQTWQCIFVRKRSRASSSTRRHKIIPSGFWRRKFRICSLHCISYTLYISFSAATYYKLWDTYFHNTYHAYNVHKIKFKIEIKRISKIDLLHLPSRVDSKSNRISFKLIYV